MIVAPKCYLRGHGFDSHQLVTTGFFLCLLLTTCYFFIFQNVFYLHLYLQGPISVSEITLPAGKPGCQTANFQFQQEIRKPSWSEIVLEGAVFLVIFNLKQDVVGTFNGPMTISAQMEKYVKFFEGEWFVGDRVDSIDMSTACSRGGSSDVYDDIHKMCILGMVLTYDEDTGFLSMSSEDWSATKELYDIVPMDETDMLVARTEWPAKHILQLDEVIGYLPCNVKWSNVLRFDPSNTEGKCLHFTASSKGTIFAIFSAIPDDRNTWYYVQISPYGVGIFKVSKMLNHCTVTVKIVVDGNYQVSSNQISSKHRVIMLFSNFCSTLGAKTNKFWACPQSMLHSYDILAQNPFS